MVILLVTLIALGFGFALLSGSKWWMGEDDGICHSCDCVKGRGYCEPCLRETE